MALGITLGDPAGIGPEIVAKSLAKFRDDELLLIGSQNNFEKILSILKMEKEDVLRDHIKFVDVGSYDAELGKIGKVGGEIALKSIEKGVDLATQGKISALATAPINKESILLAGSKYIDHTTMLQALTHSKEVSTVFEIGKLRIIFMTKHVPLLEAVKEISKEKIYEAIMIAKRGLELLGITNGKIAVAALNPHAGEGGALGNEEKEELEPAIKMASSESVKVYGPYPADSVFHRAASGEFDMVVSLYHDQGHIAAKMLDFTGTVSMNLGLPFLRTSVDHGTAFDIAGKGIADERSMIEAISKAKKYHEKYRKNYEKVYSRFK